MTQQKQSIAIIGSGATTIYLLKHIIDAIGVLKDEIEEISIFEKNSIIGMGMPYNPATTDVYNLANISSEEIPPLYFSFADWLREQDEALLKTYGISKPAISDSEVYSRLALGAYFHSQYTICKNTLDDMGIRILEHPSVNIIDIRSTPTHYELISDSRNFSADKVLIATGHTWEEVDNPEKNYYASPWPISKIIPDKNQFYNFPIGILGASLSAFDVVSTLSHRHGTFLKDAEEVVYRPHEGAENFTIVLHDANGWLPHLQYEQVEPMRNIYRHVNRQGILDLLDENGILHINVYFDTICKPALRNALLKDGLEEIVLKLEHPTFMFQDFVELMSIRHEYDNPFEGMKAEMVEANDSIQHNRPIHWKEVIDDLMYCLNYHAELLSAADILFFNKHVMPFLMNVIAALPLSSAKILLALYNAGKIQLKSGTVEIEDHTRSKNTTSIQITNNGSKETYTYAMFICCGGQKKITLKNYPFSWLVHNGKVRSARALILDKTALETTITPEEHIIEDGIRSYLVTDGIDIDASYRVIDVMGTPNNNLLDISFTHTSGIRPYSYGLQACSATTEIMVQGWKYRIESDYLKNGELIEVSKLYRDNENL